MGFIVRRICQMKRISIMTIFRPLSQDQLAKMKPVGNRFRKLVQKSPRSQKVSIRFELQVLERIKEDAAELGKPYQTHINDILRTYVAEQESA